jgi:hypothetical protein
MKTNQTELPRRIHIQARRSGKSAALVKTYVDRILQNLPTTLIACNQMMCNHLLRMSYEYWCKNNVDESNVIPTEIAQPIKSNIITAAFWVKDQFDDRSLMGYTNYVETLHLFDEYFFYDKYDKDFIRKWFMENPKGINDGYIVMSTSDRLYDPLALRFVRDYGDLINENSKASFNKIFTEYFEIASNEVYTCLLADSKNDIVCEYDRKRADISGEAFDIQYLGKLTREND